MKHSQKPQEQEQQKHLEAQFEELNVEELELISGGGIWSGWWRPPARQPENPGKGLPGSRWGIGTRPSRRL